MSTSVLFDQPGPRTRRRILLASVAAGAGLAVLAVLVVLRLHAQGQLSEEKWGPILNPANSYFVALWTGLGQALLRNVQAAVLAMAFSLLLGTLLAVTRISLPRWGRWAVVVPMELFRGLPVVIVIFFAARALPTLGVDLPLLWYLVIGLTAYNSVIIAEIVRAGLASLPRGQAEAAAAVGLTRGQSMRSILLPQAFRAMLPALISQLVVIFKDTSLGFVILYAEAVRFAQIATQIPELRNPLQLYLTVGVIFILINYLLSMLAVWVERRLSQARSPADRPGPPAAPASAPSRASDVSVG
ncbi:MAG TPA: amino acid ABC transporter permease [Pseudonocardiaceae bacterium]|nr:amino acid ABC transporter permease [Pseudonocardiaceae bacterium]